MSPLAASLEKLQQDKQDLAERRRHKQEEGQEKVFIFMTQTLHLLSVWKSCLFIIRDEGCCLYFLLDKCD